MYVVLAQLVGFEGGKGLQGGSAVLSPRSLWASGTLVEGARRVIRRLFCSGGLGISSPVRWMPNGLVGDECALGLRSVRRVGG